MKQLNVICIIFLVFQSTTLIVAQTICENAYEIAIEKSNSVPIAGTVFINEHPSKKEQFTSDWTLGNINFMDGTSAKNCNLRYNCWKDELIFLRNTDFKTGIVFKSAISNFTLNNNTTLFIKYADSSALMKQDIYLEVLAEGNISLYCHRKANYIKSSNSFAKNYQYYLKKEGDMIKISIRKSSIMPLFTEEQQKEIKSILHNNKLKFNNEYDLAKAFTIYNETIQ